MTRESGHGWLPAVAVSRYTGPVGGGVDGHGYDRPALTANEVGSLAEFSADGIQFGFSVFEGMRAYLADPAFLVFRARDHHERLAASCAALALPCPAYEVFAEAIDSAVRANWDAAATRRLYVRPVVFAAGGDVMPQRCAEYVFAVLVKRFDPVVDDEGIGVLVEGGMPRTHPLFATVKAAVNYTSSALAMRDARAAGYDTVLWLDGDGNLQECTTMNVFLWLDGRFVTPGLGSILPGVTRRTVMELLAAAGEPVVERDVHVSEVADALARGADLGVFTTSTALGVRRVARLRLGDAHHVLDGKPPGAWSRMEEQYALVTERFTEADGSYAAIMSRSQRGSK